MVDTRIPVVPRERFFSGGRTYDEFAKNADHNREYWQKLPDEIQLNDNDRAVFGNAATRLHGLNIMAIGADWCEDSLQAIPIAAKIADAIDGITLRVFSIDQPENEDLAQKWRVGDRSPIPKIIFLDNRMHEIGHMIERPQVNNEAANEVVQKHEANPGSDIGQMMTDLYRSQPQLRRNIISAYMTILDAVDPIYNPADIEVNPEMTTPVEPEHPQSRA